MFIIYGCLIFGTVMNIHLKTRERGDEPLIFKKIFIMFEAIKKSFLHDCRPWNGIDECHLNGSYGGISFV